MSYKSIINHWIYVLIKSMLDVAEEPNPPAPFPTQEGGERR